MISIVSRSMCATARFELLPGIAAIGEQSDEGGIRIAGSLDQAGRTVAVLNIGTVHHAVVTIASQHNLSILALSQRSRDYGYA